MRKANLPANRCSSSVFLKWPERYVKVISLIMIEKNWVNFQNNETILIVVRILYIG